jgi:hypothetical protein
MKLLDFVDAIFYINLSARTDKNDAITAHFNELGLMQKVVRIPGRSPADLGYSRLPTGKYELYTYSEGNAAAHRDILQRASAAGMKNILVFEDDGRIFADEGNPVALTELAISQIADIPDWQILFLGATIGDERLRLVGPNLAKVDITVCSHAFILNERAFDILLQVNPSREYDCCLARTLTQKYVVYPLNAIQFFLNKTDIGETDYTPNIDFWRDQLNKPIDRLYE